MCFLRKLESEMGNGWGVATLVLACCMWTTLPGAFADHNPNHNPPGQGGGGGGGGGGGDESPLSGTIYFWLGFTGDLAQMDPDTGQDEDTRVSDHVGYKLAGAGGILDNEDFENGDFREPGYRLARIRVMRVGDGDDESSDDESSDDD